MTAPNLKKDRRQQIMQAAEKLFTSRRFHEITLDEVAAAAGVAKGTIYGYFQDKDDLFWQTATNGFDEICGLIQTQVDARAPFQQQLLEACGLICGFYDSRHQLLRLMQSEDGRMSQSRGDLARRWQQKRKGLISALAVILARGVTDGLLRDDLPAEMLAAMLLGMLRTRAHDLKDAARELRRYEVIIDFFARGAGKRESANREFRVTS